MSDENSEEIVTGAPTEEDIERVRELIDNMDTEFEITNA